MKKETLTVETNSNGTIIYRNADGERHNPDGPAIIYADGSKSYYINDKLHNPHGPAVIYDDDYKAYWINDQRHNPNGPAVVYSDGHKEYWINDQRHNPNGPAVVCASGYKAYYINGKRLTKSEFKAWQAQQSAPLHNETLTIHGIKYKLTAI